MRRHEVQVRGVPLDVPADAEIERELVVGRPVVLEEHAELAVAGGDLGTLSGRDRGEHCLVGDAGRAGGADVIVENGVVGPGAVERRELHPLVLDAHLDRVVSGPPLQVAEGQLLFQRRALLTLVLDGARIDSVGDEDELIAGLIGIVRTVYIGVGGVGPEEGVFPGRHQHVEPAVGAALPAKIEAVVGVQGFKRG